MPAGRLMEPELMVDCRAAFALLAFLSSELRETRRFNMNR
jgi:hypothetical protein